MDSRKHLIIVSGIVLIAMLAASFWAWSVIPDGARIPIHWNLEGHTNGFGRKFPGLFIAPFVLLLISGLFAILPSIEPRKRHLMQSSKLYSATWICILALMAIVHAQILLAATGIYTSTTGLGQAGIGALFIVAGNYLSKSRSTFFMGIRTPWTLTSELSWRKTHRLGGWLFIAFGFVHIAVVFAAPKLVPFEIVGGLFGIMIFALVYSYLVWRHDPNRRTGDSISTAP